MIAALEAFVAAGGLPREEGTIGLARSSRCEGPYDLHLYPIASRPFGGKGWRFHISAAVMAPRSRGTIRLNPSDPTDPEAPPVIDTNYFSDPGEYDLDALTDAFALCRDLGAQPALASLLGDELKPGPSINSRAEIRDWILGHASHDYHPAGTCRMGPAATRRPSSMPQGRCTGWKDSSSPTRRSCPSSPWPTRISPPSSAPRRSPATCWDGGDRGRAIG